MDDFITPEEAAKQIRVTAATVKTWIRNGELKAYKFGKQWRIKLEDWNNFINVDEYLDDETESAILEKIKEITGCDNIKQHLVRINRDKKSSGSKTFTSKSRMFETENDLFFYDDGKLYQLGNRTTINKDDTKGGDAE